MHICYIDESGTSDIPGNTSHFILAGIAIPIHCWPLYDKEIASIKKKYNLDGIEIHTGWLLKKYLEQVKIPNFDKLSHMQRRSEVIKYRTTHLLSLQKKNSSSYKQTKKNYKQTDCYIHLTYAERVKFIAEIARAVGNWQDARLFAECIDKTFFDCGLATQSIDEQAFEQIISRFQQCLNLFSKQNASSHMYRGLIIHDNNQTVAKKHTELMRAFHAKGTLWTKIDNIIETPLFVDSDLTSMIQIADLCAYSLRRYLENNENELFSHIFRRADRKDGKVVGVRHFSKHSCRCTICSLHR
mgnify:CR=1 FL=1